MLEGEFRYSYLFLLAICFGFFFSLSYHYGYFYSADIKSHVLTFNDILYNYYLWIPLFSVIIIGIVMDYSRLLKVPFIEKFLLFIITTPILYFVVRNKVSVVLLITMFILLYLISQYKKKDKGKYIRKFVFSILAITATAYAMGYFDFIDSTESIDNRAMVYLSSEPTKPIEANLLLYLDRGLLIKEIDNQNIELLTWARIDSIELISQALLHERAILQSSGK